MEWEGGLRGRDICILIADSLLFEVWQKSTQHCKAIILQLKIKEKEKQLVIQCKGHFTQFNKHRLELNMSVLQFKKQQVETSLAVQWLKLRASNAGNAR